jgi:hypothetical protein
MATQKDTELMLQNKELKKENFRLQKKIAKLEVQVVSANNKARMAKPLLSDKQMKEIEESVYGKTPNKLPAA